MKRGVWLNDQRKREFGFFQQGMGGWNRIQRRPNVLWGAVGIGRRGHACLHMVLVTLNWVVTRVCLHWQEGLPVEGGSRAPQRSRAGLTNR